LAKTSTSEQPDELTGEVGVNTDLKFSILLVKNVRNFSHVSVDTSTTGQFEGLITEFIVLNNIFGLFECLLMKSR